MLLRRTEVFEQYFRSPDRKSGANVSVEQEEPEELTGGRARGDPARALFVTMYFTRQAMTAQPDRLRGSIQERLGYDIYL